MRIVADSPARTLLLVTLVLVGCGSRHVRRVDEGDAAPRPIDASGDSGRDGDADAGGDADADGGSEEPVVLECGDERLPLDVPPAPIVNGMDTFDPEVVALSEGEVLAVGAMVSHGGWGGYRSFCSGTLIGPDLVVTAAHCLDFLDPHGGEAAFAVGFDSDEPDAAIPLAAVYVHPDYRPESPSGELDLALALLAYPAAEDVPEIVPIPHNCRELRYREFLGAAVQAVGYGVVHPDGYGGGTRLWTVQHVVRLDDEVFEVDGYGESGVCNGDSGGPALWTMPDGVVRVMGVASRSESSCVDRAFYALTSPACELFESVAAGCEGLPEGGSCLGDVAASCDEGVLLWTDCRLSGSVCIHPDGGRARCVAAPDPCAGETFVGRCEGDAAVWCEDETVRRAQCDELDARCERDDAGLFRCVADPCGGIGWEGRCDGDDALWCQDGEIRLRRCADCLQRCGWSEVVGGFYCL